jgi:hypothetical protein
VKTCQGKKNLQLLTHVFEFKVNCILSNSHAKLASKAKMLKDTMVLEPNGALGVEIKLIVNLVSSNKPISKSLRPS